MTKSKTFCRINELWSVVRIEFINDLTWAVRVNTGNVGAQKLMYGMFCLKSVFGRRGFKVEPVGIFVTNDLAELLPMNPLA